MTNQNNDTESREIPGFPRIGYIDMDSLLFAAASAAENTWYLAVTSDGSELGRFAKAKDYNEWIKDFQELGFDPVFDYQGTAEDIERVVEHEIQDFDVAKQVFDRKVKEWLRMAGVEKWRGFISGKSGDAENFRYEIATLFPYKGGREDMRKPYWLEDVREYALTYEEIRAVPESCEADDLSVLMAEKNKDKAVCIFIDKDQLQCSGTWVLHIDNMDSLVYSPSDIVGTLSKTTDEQGKVKVVGLGHLFTLYQMLAGDKAVDNIGGCKGIGPVKAYDILKEFSGKGSDSLEKAVWAVCECYRDKYGDSYEYTPQGSEKKLCVSWRDVFEENLRLLWMLRYKGDRGEKLSQYADTFLENIGGDKNDTT